jgi:PilZ domain
MFVNSSDNIETFDETAEGRPQQDPVRTAVRFPIHLPITLQTSEGEMEATTLDISACGLLFRAGRTLPMNTRLEFDIPMPAAILGTQTDVSVHCIGRVVRTSNQNGDEHHTAVVIDEYSFRT